MIIHGRLPNGRVPEFIANISRDMIRIDDVNNSEFWMEIYLTPEEIKQLANNAPPSLME